MSLFGVNLDQGGVIGISEFSKPDSYIERSPANSNSSDDSSLSQFIDCVSFDMWNECGGNDDFEDVKNILNCEEPVKEVVAFHHLPRNVCPSTCSICGDKATGYHYEVPSCNGCKTFFRRTVLSQRNYECNRGGNCFNILPKEKRYTCRACRFEKCVEVGMNPLAIQTADSLDSNSLVTNIVGKRKMMEVEIGPSTSKVKLETITISDPFDRLIDGLVYLDIKVEEFRKCSFNPPFQQYAKLTTLLDSHSLISVSDKLGPMPNWPVSQLSPEEMAERRMNIKFEPTSPERKNWFVYDILTSVEYAKTFMFMHKIEKNDQILLLKSVVLKLMNLNQSFYSYEQKFDFIHHPDGTSPHIPKTFSEGPKLFENEGQFKDFMSALIHIIRENKMDRREYVLFKAITLCNSSICGLSEYAREVLDREKEKFSNALLNYCLVNRGRNGPAHFAACIALSNVLEIRQKRQKDFYLLMKMMVAQKECHHELVDDIMEDV